MTDTFFRQALKIPGWPGFDDFFLLYYLASKYAKKHPAVEIGSFHGKSTIFIACGIQAGGSNVKLFAIDPHEGRLSARQRVVPSLSAFWANLAAFKLSEKVSLIQKKSLDAVKNWHGPISMIHVDGLHDFANASADMLAWSKFLVSGGVITCHDAFGPSSPDVTRAVLKLAASLPVKQMGTAGSEVYLVKGEPTLWEKFFVWKMTTMLKLNLVVWQDSKLPAVAKIVMINFMLKPAYLEPLTFAVFFWRTFKLPIKYLCQIFI